MKAFEPASNSTKSVYTTITIEMWIVLCPEFIFITYFPSIINNLWLLIFPSVYLSFNWFASSTSLLLKSVTSFGTQTDNYYSFLLNFKEEQLFWISGLDTMQINGLLYTSILILTQNAISIGGMSLQTGGILKNTVYENSRMKYSGKFFVIWDQLLNAFEL